jgi:Tol biopolymer transport system component
VSGAGGSSAVVGTRIGPYQILAPLGAGGMGEVYRATDTNLARQVAIKVLPASVAADPERLARFDREAKILAALNHPNIAAIYGVERAGGVTALAMELIEGPTLADRIARGPIPLDEALAIVRQIAAALAAAHEQGIVHRDLKPANIKLKDAWDPVSTHGSAGERAPARSAPHVADDVGTVKVLDFGLAKTIESTAASGDAANSPTITSPAMTEIGMILGTAAYMSPEQARGRPVDKRADIWAFGCVLYEMLTGRRAFSGEDITETLASVVKEQPDLAVVPPVVRRALARCFEKDPKKRLRDIGDVWDLIGEPASAIDAPPSRARAGWRAWALAGAFVAAVASAGTFAFLWQRVRVPSPHAVEFELLPPDGTQFGAGLGRAPVVSPDGRAIAFVAETGQDASLWVRRLDSTTAWSLSGTKGAACPFWSPDSQSVAFFQDGKLRRTAMVGGSSRTLTSVAGACLGASWSQGGTIVLGTRAGLFSVSASGGALQPLRVPDAARSERAIGAPQFLPDGRHFLFYTLSADERVGGTYISSIDAPAEETRVLPDDVMAHYVAPEGQYPGFLLWPRDQTLVAQRFDAGSLRLDGDPSPVVDNVELAQKGLALFSPSDTGVLVYRIGTSTGSPQGLARSTLAWFDRTGHAAGTVGDPQNYGELALSPDGSRVAAFRGDAVGQDLWFIDIARGAAARLTTDPGNESYPVWSPDGKQIAFGSDRKGSFDLYRTPAGVSGQEAALLENGDRKDPLDWSSDGRYLLYDQYQTSAEKPNWDLWVLPMDGSGKPAKYLATPFTEANAKFSPDGRWVAYQSNQSARFEIYVSPFPDAAAVPATLVSTTGGTYPRWARDGRSLSYLSADDELMEVPVTLGTTLKVGTPVPLFKLPPLQALGGDVGGWAWDVAADGQRFLMNTVLRQEGPAPFTIDTDWRAKLPR